MVEPQITTVEANVLVIGAGFAGMWAALRASQLVDNIVLVEKGHVGYSGCSTLASGVQACVLPDDDQDLWEEEMVARSEYFCDQDWVKKFLELQPRRIQDYVSWGAPIEQDETGKIKRLRARGDINTSVFMFHGRKLIKTLASRLAGSGVRIINRIMITELLTRKEGDQVRVVGAIGLGTRTGDIFILRAKTVVLATGGIRPLKPNRVGTVTGDGQAMAFRVGAELTGMEFCTTGNINLWSRRGYAGGINMIQGHGARIVNALGERFMPRYDPILQERALRHVLIMAYVKEVLSGRGPVYVDMRHLSPDTFDTFRTVIPHAMKLIDRLGVDLAREPIENAPVVEAPGTATGDGGILIGLRAQTSIAGLYAAGAVTANPIGQLESIGGLPTASCNVLGYVAGEQAALETQEMDFAREEEQREEIRDKIQGLLRPLGNQGARADDLRQQLLSITTPARYSLVKHERRIRQVLIKLGDLKEQANDLAASDPHELVKVHEMRNLLLMAEMVYRGAMERRESRAFHYREEYPYTDNENWVCHLVFRQKGQNLFLSRRPLLKEHWRHRPQPYKTAYPVQIFTED